MIRYNLVIILKHSIPDLQKQEDAKFSYQNKKTSAELYTKIYFESITKAKQWLNNKKTKEYENIPVNKENWIKRKKTKIKWSEYGGWIGGLSEDGYHITYDYEFVKLTSYE